MILHIRLFLMLAFARALGIRFNINIRHLHREYKRAEFRGVIVLSTTDLKVAMEKLRALEKETDRVGTYYLSLEARPGKLEGKAPVVGQGGLHAVVPEGEAGEPAVSDSGEPPAPEPAGPAQGREHRQQAAVGAQLKLSDLSPQREVTP